MRRKTGFTLIELILALAVMASVSILVLPALFGRSHQQQRLIESTDHLVQVLRTARQHAMDNATPVCVCIVNSSPNFRCYAMRDQSISHVAALPPGVSIHALTKDREGRAVTDIAFREDGSAINCEFEIRCHQISKRIVIERLTGHVSIEEMAE